jgi:hypothetical protein
MTEVNFNKNIYSYGIYYDADRVKVPTDEQNWTGLIIYVHPKREDSRIISSLEGYFVSDNDSLFSSYPVRNAILDKKQMKDFEEMYKGQFIPFEK